LAAGAFRFEKNAQSFDQESRIRRSTRVNHTTTRRDLISTISQSSVFYCDINHFAVARSFTAWQQQVVCSYSVDVLTSIQLTV